MKLISFLFLLIIINTSIYAQPPIKYLGTYGSSGLPDYLEPIGDTVNQGFLNRIAAAVPEYQPVPDYHPSYLDNNYRANIDLFQSADVFITYVAEGAGYKNVLGFYTYTTGLTPTLISQIDSIIIIFPNVSNAGSGGLLNPGDKVKIGHFPAGTSIGFVVFANGYSSGSNTVGYGQWQHYSDKMLNPPSDTSLKQHTVVLYDQITEKYVICFEDITRPGGDKDFNDAIFYSTTNPPSAAITTNVPSLPMVWEGTVDTTWENTANWNPQQLPDSTSTVTISANAPNFPTIDNSLVVDELIVEPGATININGHHCINVSGDYTSNNLVNGEVKFVGDNDQSIYGAATFTDLVVENGNTVNVQSDIIITGTLELIDGDFETNNNEVIIESSNSNNGMLLETSGNVSGDITFERYIPNVSGYHYLTSPVQNATLADLNDDFTLLSLGGNLNSLPFPNIFYYDETDTSSHKTDGWLVPSNLSSPMGVGVGFATNVSMGITVDVTGMPNNGPINIPLTYTQSAYSPEQEHCPSDGWNLIGNPYPSNIDWDLLTLDTTIENGIYLWNPLLNQYSSYINGVGVNGGSSLIAPFQGFFVRATIATTLPLTNSIRTSESSTDVFQKGNPNPLLKVKIIQNGKSDETAIYTNMNNTNSFNQNQDAYKMRGNDPTIPQISTIHSNTRYSINGIPSISSPITTIPVNVIPSVTGIYTIEASEISDFSPSVDILLYDQLQNTYTNLTYNNYSFTMNAVDTAQRFFIHFQEIITGEETLNNDVDNINIYGFNNTVYIKIKEEEPLMVSIYNLLGRTIYTKKYSSYSELIDIPLSNIKTGIYIVETRVNGKQLVKKVLLNK